MSGIAEFTMVYEPWIVEMGIGGGLEVFDELLDGVDGLSKRLQEQTYENDDQT